MRLISFLDAAGEPRTGALAHQRIIDLTERIAALALPADVKARGLEHVAGLMRLLCAGAQAMAAMRRAVDETVATRIERLLQLHEVRLLAPLARPGKIVGVGRNYGEHAKEIGAHAAEQPRLFAKFGTSVVGPRAVVRRPAGVMKLDLEAELAVVIGACASNVTRENALACVAGYTVLNDLSAREFQFDLSPAQTTFAKSMDGFCPMGPWLVTADEIPDPQQLEIKSFVNDVPMQHGHTADMLFPVDRIIEYVSRFITLEPGDVIATGTPAGVGAFRNPPVWLQPGDRVRIEIARIGVLEHGIG